MESAPNSETNDIHEDHISLFFRKNPKNCDICTILNFCHKIFNFWDFYIIFSPNSAQIIGLKIIVTRSRWGGIISKKKIKKCKKKSENLEKFGNFELWKSAKNTIDNFFTLFLLQYHHNNVFYHFQKSEWKNLFSFPPKTEKREKPRKNAENREYRENIEANHFLNPEFGISDQKWFRIHLQTYWDPQLIIFCCTV